MSLQDEPRVSTDGTTGTPFVVPVSDVPPGARVRHFDELSERTQDAVVAATPSGRLDVDPATTRLSRGDVVVYTDYLRVQ